MWFRFGFEFYGGNEYSVDLKGIGVSDKVTVQHYDLSSASPSEADVWFVGQDLENSAGHLGDVQLLKSIIDMNELREKVTQACKDKGLIA